MHLPSRIDVASSHQASSPASHDGIIRVGSIVQVLPGRQFPSFSAGDVGVVKRVDDEARTCDVVFDHGAGPLTVAMRHLKLSQAQDFATPNGLSESLARMDQILQPGLHSPKASRHSPADLEAQLASQQHALNSMEARLVACEAALSVEDSRGKPAGRLVAARVAALEGAHQAEVNELRRALNEVAGLSREQDNVHRKHRSTGRELEQLFQSLEQRCQSLQDSARRLETEISGLTASMSGHERRAAKLQDVVASSNAGLSELAALLEGQERRTVDLAQALSTARKDLADLADRFEASRRSERRDRERELKSPGSTRALEGQDADAIWKALRELQELVVHESEHRAAGLREVLGVIGKDAEQLRNDQTRHEAEIEGRCKADALKIKHHIAESQARISEYEKQTNRVDKRLDALSQALSAERNARIEAFVWLEEQVRDVQPSVTKGSSAPSGVVPDSPLARNDSPSREEAPTRVSLKRLQALEAKFEKKSQAVYQSEQRPTSTTTEETLEKLRGQLDGLRAELKVAGVRPEATATYVLSPRSLRAAEVRTVSPTRLMQATQLPPRVVYSYQTVAAPAAPQASGFAEPTATVGIDLNKDGKADIPAPATDLNDESYLQAEAVFRGKQPNSPRVTLCTGPAKGYVRPTEFTTFG
ncbi:unnamed protein product [Symbiodinium sp. CCMP2592]|nr:unnamed protein product [Symbiodinium sp. CCMP2592]